MLIFASPSISRPRTASSSISAHTFAYSGLLLDTETIVSSAGTNIIDRSYDSLGRASGFSAGRANPPWPAEASERRGPGEPSYSVAYGYDSVGRFSSLTSDICSLTSAFNYSYLPNSDLISSLSSALGPPWPRSGRLSSVSTRTYEQNWNLLTQIKNEVNSSLISQFDYANDAGGRRTSIKHSGSAFETGPAFNLYGYNSRNEVLSGNRYWGSDLGDLSQPVVGQSYGYQYDNIGNRQTANRGTNTETYIANNLHQYTQKTVPNQIDIIGSATTGSTVTVNSQSVSRHGKYWYKGLTVTNAVYQSVNVMGIYNPPGTNDPDVISTASGHVFAAKSPEVFTYDNDGIA